MHARWPWQPGGDLTLPSYVEGLIDVPYVSGRLLCDEIVLYASNSSPLIEAFGRV